MKTCSTLSCFLPYSQGPQHDTEQPWNVVFWLQVKHQDSFYYCLKCLSLAPRKTLELYCIRHMNISWNANWFTYYCSMSGKHELSAKPCCSLFSWFLGSVENAETTFCSTVAEPTIDQLVYFYQSPMQLHYVQTSQQTPSFLGQINPQYQIVCSNCNSLKFDRTEGHYQLHTRAHFISFTLAVPSSNFLRMN